MDSRICRRQRTWMLKSLDPSNGFEQARVATLAVYGDLAYYNIYV